MNRTIFFLIVLLFIPESTVFTAQDTIKGVTKATESGFSEQPAHKKGSDISKERGQKDNKEKGSLHVLRTRQVSNGTSSETTFQNELGMTFVHMKPGTFVMGSPPHEAGRKENEELHSFTILKPYYIQTTEVTEKQWVTVMGENPSFFTTLCGENCPVENVSWFDVQKFIEILNNKFPQKHLIYRLPNEAEWEFAARAGSQKALYTGDLLNPYTRDSKLDEIAWYWDNSGNRPHPIAQLAPNNRGLYDMLGNVWEWCEDWYDVRYLYSLADNVEEPSGDKLKVVRGGGWYSIACRTRCASRDGAAPALKNGDVGFRLVAESKETFMK